MKTERGWLAVDPKPASPRDSQVEKHHFALGHNQERAREKGQPTQKRIVKKKYPMLGQGNLIMEKLRGAYANWTN